MKKAMMAPRDIANTFDAYSRQEPLQVWQPGRNWHRMRPLVADNVNMPATSRWVGPEWPNKNDQKHTMAMSPVAGGKHVGEYVHLALTSSLLGILTTGELSARLLLLLEAGELRARTMRSNCKVHGSTSCKHDILTTWVGCQCRLQHDQVPQSTTHHGPNNPHQRLGHGGLHLQGSVIIAT